MFLKKYLLESGIIFHVFSSFSLFSIYSTGHVKCLPSKNPSLELLSGSKRSIYFSWSLWLIYTLSCVFLSNKKICIWAQLTFWHRKYTSSLVSPITTIITTKVSHWHSYHIHSLLFIRNPLNQHITPMYSRTTWYNVKGERVEITQLILI